MSFIPYEVLIILLAGITIGVILKIQELIQRRGICKQCQRKLENRK